MQSRRCGRRREAYAGERRKGRLRQRCGRLDNIEGQQERRVEVVLGQDSGGVDLVVVAKEVGSRRNVRVEVEDGMTLLVEVRVEAVRWGVGEEATTIVGRGGGSVKVV